MQRVQPSGAAFAIVMIAIGMWGLVKPGFVAIWAPGIQPAGLRPAMAFACSVTSTGTGVGLLLRRYASFAACVLLAFLCLWLVWCKGLALFYAPVELASWESLGETAVIASAAWSLAMGLDEDRAEQRSAGQHTGAGPRVLYGLALIAFGASHLGYVALTASLVPAWLPWHVAWVYVTAATYVAAGIALVVGRLVGPAAALSALQMALFGILVWLPKIAAGAVDADTLNETAISFTLAASGWVIADAVKRPYPLGRRVKEPTMSGG